MPVFWVTVHTLSWRWLASNSAISIVCQDLAVVVLSILQTQKPHVLRQWYNANSYRNTLSMVNSITSLTNKIRMEVHTVIESQGVMKMNWGGCIKYSSGYISNTLEFPAAWSLWMLQLLRRKVGTVVLTSLLLLSK